MGRGGEWLIIVGALLQNLTFGGGEEGSYRSGLYTTSDFKRGHTDQLVRDLLKNITSTALANFT